MDLGDFRPPPIAIAYHLKPLLPSFATFASFAPLRWGAALKDLESGNLVKDSSSFAAAYGGDVVLVFEQDTEGIVDDAGI